MEALTERQQQILEFIASFSHEEGYWPSIRDIQHHFKFRSTNAVAGHLRALTEKKAISRIHGKARTFRILPAAIESLPTPAGAMDVIEIPVYGNIAAGYPDGVEQGDAVGRIQIDVQTLGMRRSRKAFALRVRGDSMIDAGIFEGDTVVFDIRPPRNNDIVAALIDGETTLKRYISQAGCSPYLKAENIAYPELHPFEELIVQGVAQAVVRRLS